MYHVYALYLVFPIVKTQFLNRKTAQSKSMKLFGTGNL